MGIFRYILQMNFGLEFWTALVSTLMVVLICLPVHEYAHGWVAHKLGDPTAKSMGRLDLNPIAHLDPIGTVAIFLFGFGWARPVPVNPYYFKNRKRGMAITALAGPVSNILLALVVMLLLKLVWLAAAFLPSMSETVYNMLYVLQLILGYMISLNLSLAVFNLVPIPPLDGSKVLGAVLPDRIYSTVLRYERYAILVVYLVMFSGILDGPMTFVIRKLYSLLNFLTGFVDLIANLVH